MVGAGFRVMKDVPPFALAGNQPLGFSGVNVIGLRRRGFAEETIELIKLSYQLIYQSGYNITDGTNVAEKMYGESDVVRRIIDFVRSSKRGVIPISR